MLHGLENEISPIVTEWMGKELVCDIDVIKTADSKDLKRKNTQIYDLMPDIADCLNKRLYLRLMGLLSVRGEGENTVLTAFKVLRYYTSLNWLRW